MDSSDHRSIRHTKESTVFSKTEESLRLNTFEILEVLGLTEGSLDSFTADQYLHIARGILKLIDENLPAKVAGSSMSKNSKIPFKIVVLRETLAYRVSELTSTALQLYDSVNIVPAFIITRATIETVCLMFSLHKHVVEFNRKHNIEKFDAFLMKSMLGCRNGLTPYKSENILDSIDRADKVFNGIRVQYECLCEYTHPNWSGVLCSYGDVDDNYLLSFEERRDIDIKIGLTPFILSLVIFQSYYNNLIPYIYRINAYFDSKEDQGL